MVTVGRLLVGLGLLIAVLGGVVLLMNHFGWRLKLLPGDLLVRRPGLTIYFPVVTCLALSVIATAVLYIIALLRR